MKFSIRFVGRVLSALALLTLCETVAAQGAGPLNPPGGPPVPLGKWIGYVDPGTPLDPEDFAVNGMTISTSGSYYLTGNVNTINANVAVFTITASNVTIDLRGFSILAAGNTGTIPAHSAIAVTNPALRNITVRNGTIGGPWYAAVYALDVESCTIDNLRIGNANSYGIIVGAHGRVSACHVEGDANSGGIFAGDHSLLERSLVANAGGIRAGLSSSIVDCIVSESNSAGIRADHSSLARCVVSLCATNGFEVGVGSTLVDCIARENDGDGFSTFTGSVAGSVFRGCIALSNGGEGFDLGGQNVLTDCTAYANDNNGFSAGAGSVLSHCGASLNGQLATNANADGFEISSSAKVQQCTAHDNRGMGIRGTNTQNYLEGNIITDNNGGGIDLTSSVNVVIRNFMGGNGIIPASGFQINPAPSGNIGPVQPANSATSPFANFVN